MKNVQLGGFAGMRCEDKDGIQIISVSGEVDLSGVEFIDTAGLEVLLEEWNASRQFDRRLCLVAQQGPITRLLELTGLSNLLDLYAEPEVAVKSCALTPA